jgi:hypothetical protein
LSLAFALKCSITRSGIEHLGVCMSADLFQRVDASRKAGNIEADLLDALNTISDDGRAAFVRAAQQNGVYYETILYLYDQFKQFYESQESLSLGITSELLLKCWSQESLFERLSHIDELDSFEALTLLEQFKGEHAGVFQQYFNDEVLLKDPIWSPKLSNIYTKLLNEFTRNTGGVSRLIDSMIQINPTAFWQQLGLDKSEINRLFEYFSGSLTILSRIVEKTFPGIESDMQEEIIVNLLFALEDFNQSSTIVPIKEAFKDDYSRLLESLRKRQFVSPLSYWKHCLNKCENYARSRFNELDTTEELLQMLLPSGLLYSFKKYDVDKAHLFNQWMNTCVSELIMSENGFFMSKHNVPSEQVPLICKSNLLRFYQGSSFTMAPEEVDRFMGSAIKIETTVSSEMEIDILLRLCKSIGFAAKDDSDLSEDTGVAPVFYIGALQLLGSNVHQDHLREYLHQLIGSGQFGDYREGFPPADEQCFSVDCNYFRLSRIIQQKDSLDVTPAGVASMLRKYIQEADLLDNSLFNDCVEKLYLSLEKLEQTASALTSYSALNDFTRILKDIKSSLEPGNSLGLTFFHTPSTQCKQLHALVAQASKKIDEYLGKAQLDLQPLKQYTKQLFLVAYHTERAKDLVKVLESDMHPRHKLRILQRQIELCDSESQGPNNSNQGIEDCLFDRAFLCSYQNVMAEHWADSHLNRGLKASSVRNFAPVVSALCDQLQAYMNSFEELDCEDFYKDPSEQDHGYSSTTVSFD